MWKLRRWGRGGGVRDDIYISGQLDGGKLAWARREVEDSFGIRAGIRFSFVPSVANKGPGTREGSGGQTPGLEPG